MTGEYRLSYRLYDASVGGANTNFLMTLVTGDISPLGLQRQFNLSRVHFLGEYTSAHAVSITTYPDFAATSVSASKAISAAPEQVSTRPASCMRIQSVRFQIAEQLVTTGTPPVTVVGAGFKFVGLALELQDYGKIATLSTARII